MKKIIYLFSSLLLFVSCQTPAPEPKEITEIKDSGDEIPYNILADSDTFEFDQNNDTNSFVYPELTIQTLPKLNRPGESIWMLKDGERRNIILDDTYFYGKVGNYLLFDIGTSTVRMLEIYKADNLQHILTVEEYRDLSVEGQIIKFKTRVDIHDASQAPQCPEELRDQKDNTGYLQTRSFDLNTKKLYISNQIECAYVE